MKKKLKNQNKRNVSKKIVLNKIMSPWGSGGSLVVSELAVYFDDPSLSSAEVYSFCCKIIFERNKN